MRAADFRSRAFRRSRKGWPVSRNGDSRVRSASFNGLVSVTATHAAHHRRSCPNATGLASGRRITRKICSAGKMETCHQRIAAGCEFSTLA